MLTEEQKQILATALRAETNAGVVAALAIRNDVLLAQWCNAPSAVDAWNPAVGRQTMFEATDVTKFDGLTGGKRDAWKLMMDNAPIDFTRQKLRKVCQDVWGTADSVAVLQSFIMKATNAQNYLGGTAATTNTVTALKLNFLGTVSTDEVSMALNAY